MKHMLLLLGSCLVLIGCATTQREAFHTPDTGAPAPWTHLDFRNNPDNFQFAIVSDRNGGNRPGVFPDAIKKLNWLQPEFVMSVGDFIEGYTENTDKIARQMDEVDEELAALEMAFFRVPGNHDAGNPVEIEAWKERYGKLYYHFLYKNVLFLCVDTEDPVNARLSEEQLRYFETVLADNRDVRWTFVFMHNPLWAKEGDIERPVADSNWDRFETALGDRPYTVFAGHWHQYAKFERNRRDYYVLSATGGGIDAQNPDLGIFDHVTWVTVNDAGPRIANLALSGILPDDVLTATADIAARALASSGFRVEIDPLFASGSSFKGGATELRLVNASPISLRVAGRFDAHPQMVIDPSTFEAIVEPGTTHALPLTFAAVRGTTPEKLPPVRGEAEVTYTLPGDSRERTLTRPLSYRVIPSLDAARVKKSVTVDGDLSDWGKLPIVAAEPEELQFDAAAWKGPHDCAFRIGVAYDAEFLYAAIEVTDDEVVCKDDAYPWEQDAVEFRLQAQDEPMRSQSRGQGEFKDTLLVAIVPGQSADRLFGSDKLPAGVRAVSKPSPTGHVTEIAIPIDYLDRQQGKAWEAVRINVAVDDCDTDGNAQVWWQPDWRRNGNYPGSGTFFRN